MAQEISYGPSLAELTFVMMDLFSRNNVFLADRKTQLTVYDPEGGETKEDESEVEVSITGLKILNVDNQEWILEGRIEVCHGQMATWEAKYSTKTLKGSWWITSTDCSPEDFPKVWKLWSHITLAERVMLHTIHDMEHYKDQKNWPRDIVKSANEVAYSHMRLRAGFLATLEKILQEQPAISVAEIVAKIIQAN